VGMLPVFVLHVVVSAVVSALGVLLAALAAVLGGGVVAAQEASEGHNNIQNAIAV
jgi:hypothetical protein